MQPFAYGLLTPERTSAPLPDIPIGSPALLSGPGDRPLVGRSWDQTIHVWNTETGERQHVLVGHTDDVDIVVFSPDGRTIASGSQDNTVRLWDAETGAHLKTLVAHWAYIITIAFSPDGTLLASGSEDDTVRLWDVATGERLGPSLGDIMLVSRLSLSITMAQCSLVGVEMRSLLYGIPPLGIGCTFSLVIVDMS